MTLSEDWIYLDCESDLEEYLVDYCDEYTDTLDNLYNRPVEYPCLIRHIYDEDNDEYTLVCVYAEDAEILSE